VHRVIRDKAAAGAAGAAPLFIFWATVMKSAAPLRTPRQRRRRPLLLCAAAPHGPTTLNPHV
jgi:hypothetical protein